MEKQHITFKTVGVTKEKRAVEAEMTIEISTIMLIHDFNSNEYSVNLVSNPNVGWSITKEQFEKLEAILKPTRLI